MTARIGEKALAEAQGRNQVYGIRDHNLGKAMGSGSANFLMSWRGSRINRFLDTLIFIRSKNIPFCKEKAMKKASFQDYWKSF